MEAARAYIGQSRWLRLRGLHRAFQFTLLRWAANARLRSTAGTQRDLF